MKTLNSQDKNKTPWIKGLRTPATKQNAQDETGRFAAAAKMVLKTQMSKFCFCPCTKTWFFKRSCNVQVPEGRGLRALYELVRACTSLYELV